MSFVAAVVVFVFLAFIGVVYYTWKFIFLVGTGPSGQPYDMFVMQTCSSKGREAFMKTTYTWGYYKRSFKRCFRYYKLMLFPVPLAKLGGRCSDAKLVALDGSVKYLLADYVNKLPKGNVDVMSEIYKHYCDDKSQEFPAVAKFLTIYLEEAHAKDEWYLPDSPDAQEGGRTCVLNHRNINDRIIAAKAFMSNYHYPTELVCDSFNDEVSERFDAWPEKLYIILDGYVVYEGGNGPFDYKLCEVQDWLIERYGLRGEVITRR